MLNKIRKKSVGQRRNTKGSSHIRIIKSVAIPNILGERIQPISQEQPLPGNVGFTLQESESQLVHQHTILSNAQSSTRINQLERQGQERTSEEPLTGNISETSWTSENGELDIKYQIRTNTENTDVAIDPLQLELEHLDFPQQNEFVGQIAIKSEVNDLPNVTSFSNAEEATSTEGSLFRIDPPPTTMNFICGTCGVGFASYNQLKNHDRIHMKSTNGKSIVKNIRQKKGKSRHKTTKLTPSLIPRKCEDCGKVLSTYATWKYHVMSIHRGQYKFKCILCNYGCQKSSHLRRHIAEHSVNNGDFKCFKCNRGFKSEHSRSIHLSKCSVFVESVEHKSVDARMKIDPS